MIPPHRPRIALIADPPEEGWVSMDLAACMVRSILERDHAGRFESVEITPHLPGLSSDSRAIRPKLARNAVRLFGRHVSAVRQVRRRLKAERFDLVHVIDHSYAHLVPLENDGPKLPTVVTCYDLDAFRCLTALEAEPRPWWFRKLARRVLRGLRRADRVVCASAATQSGLVEHGLVAEDRLRLLHLGVHPECSTEPDAQADARAAELMGDQTKGPILLHVGTNIPRKRIDVLLETFAGVLAVHSGARLVKAGGPFEPEQRERAERLGIVSSIRTLPKSDPTQSRDRALLAAIYRRADVLLLPSDAEGFGLPIVEALACGTAVLASDLPVLREVGGDACAYAPVGDVPAWIRAVLMLLKQPEDNAATQRRVERAARYSWSAHVAGLAELYQELLA